MVEKRMTASACLLSSEIEKKKKHSFPKKKEKKIISNNQTRKAILYTWYHKLQKVITKDRNEQKNDNQGNKKT